ncbi:MAG TPA: hypothetical protein VFV02_09555, partial [Acidimicrobiales bacterium]|nr:hypothetical protein [Acidimicrobiales bacterium]
MGGRGAVLTLGAGLLAGVSACGASVAPSGSAYVAAAKAATSATTVITTTPTSPIAPSSSGPPLPTTPTVQPSVWAHHTGTSDGDSIPRPAWASVAVLTVWDRPDLVRSVDTPILGTSPLTAQWIAAMDFGQKLDL